MVRLTKEYFNVFQCGIFMFRRTPGTYILLAVFATISWLHIAVNATAQSVELTSPLQSTSLMEADDYASVVLRNPWDMNERRDIGWEENFVGTSITVDKGVWKGTLKDPGGYILPLFPGFPGSLFPEPLDGDKTLPKLGIDHPIDSSKYYMLSFKYKHSSRSSFTVLWNADTTDQYWPDASQMGASFDGFYTPKAGISYPNNSWVVYSFDMKNLKTSFDQVKGSWSGDIVALRLDPSISAPAGSKLEFDWVRLVDPSTSPDITVSWNSSSLPYSKTIQIYMDSDNSGYDGAPMKTFANNADPGSYTFNSGILPPGTYYFYVQVNYGTDYSKAIRSGYSAAVTITSTPSGYFTSPTTISGKDYATTELGNPWNMDTAADVSNLPGSNWSDDWRQYTSSSFVNGIFQAVAVPGMAGHTETDVQVHLNVSPTKKIDTSKYRYLTYRIAADTSQFNNLHDMIEKGFVSRPVYWDLGLFGDGGHTKAHVLFEDYHTYTIDLWKDGINEAGRKWKDNRELSHLRIDPLETSVNNWFFLDWVMLTTENYVEGNKADIGWVIENTSSTTLTTSLYYDTDDTGYNGKLITTIRNCKVGQNSYTWDTSKIGEDKTLYVYAVISDGTTSSRFYAAAPVKTGTYVPPPKPRPVPYDYDGDFKSDEIVYRQEAGGVFFSRESTVGPVVVQWGGSTYKPIHGDFDGDGKADYAVVINNGGYIYWFIFRSSDATLIFSIWGLEGDIPVIGDYNGDAKDDIAVWRPADGTWYVLFPDGTMKVQQWGLPGDIPVPGDYDGDGKTDTAIWRPDTGTWWALNSSKAIGAAGYYSVAQWGLPGDTPLVGDFDGDGKDDFTVFRPSYGMWYVKGSKSSTIEMAQWGLPGDVPMVGDYDGDGVTDFSVYRPSAAMWYHNFRRNGEYSAIQWGLPTDLLP